MRMWSTQGSMVRSCLHYCPDPVWWILKSSQTVQCCCAWIPGGTGFGTGKPAGLPFFSTPGSLRFYLVLLFSKSGKEEKGEEDRCVIKRIGKSFCQNLLLNLCCYSTVHIIVWTFDCSWLIVTFVALIQKLYFLETPAVWSSVVVLSSHGNLKGQHGVTHLVPNETLLSQLASWSLVCSFCPPDVGLVFDLINFFFGSTPPANVSMPKNSTLFFWSEHVCWLKHI